MTNSEQSSPNFRNLFAACAAITVFGFAFGMTYPLLSLILEKRGVSTDMIGVNSAMMPLGILLFSSAIPVLAQRFGARRIAIIAALVMIVIGWRSTPETFVYVLPPWSSSLGMLLMVVAFILFGAAQYPTRIKRVLRHPMLTAVVVWSFAHLLMNGTTRAFVLFGGLAGFAFYFFPGLSRKSSRADD